MKYTIVFIGLFLTFLLNAQESEENVSEPAEQAVAAQQEEVETSEQNKEVAEAGADGESQPGFDVFRPSEDISEDLAVPFPVDI